MFKAVVFLILTWVATTSVANPLFQQAAERYRIKPALLHSIAEMESQMHPWAVNLNWEGFKPRSKADAIQLVEAAQANPWLLRLDYPDESQRLFFPTQKL